MGKERSAKTWISTNRTSKRKKMAESFSSKSKGKPKDKIWSEIKWENYPQRHQSAITRGAPKLTGN